MCLGIPGQIIRWINRDPLFAEADISFDGLVRACQMACVPDAAPGDYVIVHAGIAIARIDQQQAQETLRELRLAGEPTAPGDHQGGS